MCFTHEKYLLVHKLSREPTGLMAWQVPNRYSWFFPNTSPFRHSLHCLKACALFPSANEVWGKVMFLDLSVSRSVHRRSVMVSLLVMDSITPLDSNIPLDRTPGQYPPNKRVVRILLECFLVDVLLTHSCSVEVGRSYPVNPVFSHFNRTVWNQQILQKHKLA